MSEWVLTTERLPAVGMKVVFCTEEETYSGTFGGYLNIGFYDWQFNSESDPYGGYFPIRDVKAWMPLPKPYTEVKSNDNDQ